MTKGILVGKVVNGKLVIEGESWISSRDQGLLYGYGLFETMRVYGGRIFALEAHLQRLLISGDQLGIVKGLSLEDLGRAAGEYVGKNQLDSGALRLTLTKGEPHQGIYPAVVLSSRELTYFPGDYEQGFSAMISHVRKNQTSPLVYHKTLNYLDNLLSLQAAREAGTREALFLNTNGLLTEGALSNLFFVRDGVIHTPAVACGLLDGIARRTVFELAATGGYKLVEGEYVPEDLLAADEAFLTNSLMEVMPLVKVGGDPIGDGKSGRVTGDLLERYKALALRFTLPRF
ncbi:MAG: aminotransferase class IV [Firmicutes bacterium]|nr:aminotransferase class IV [Bacillota bacterium]